MAEHLLQLGHRRIAVLSGPRDISIVAERVAGYVRALHEAGLEMDASLVHYDELTQNAGYRMAQLALQLTPRPTALLAVNNFIAIGAIRALRDAGLEIPDDMALVGFDDLPDYLVIEPFLTAAAQPAYEMGKRAMELLRSRLSRPSPKYHEQLVLPTTLVIRRSSGGQITPLDRPQKT